MTRDVVGVVVLAGLVAWLAAVLFGGVTAGQPGPRLVGLVELPGLFGVRDPDGPPGMIRPAETVPVPLHAEPDPASARVASVSAADSLVWAEFDYEAPAALAYGEAGGWALVALREETGRRYGWVPPGHRGPLHALGTLLEQGLAYLTSDWDGLLREEPSPGARSFRSERGGSGDPVDVNVLRTVESEGVTWIQVELLGPGRCTSASMPSVGATGWVPALADGGMANAWFYSRGC
ncbi:MAG TPA: hypothetical protein VMM12_18595 [Longimicrobiales bacterium]|nr:hypothetical protein [Longimicrobiales bacterium]